MVHANYAEIKRVLRGLHIDAIDGCILDLGVSSYQLDTPQRGFSYQNDAPLDMRMDTTQFLSAYDIVNEYSQRELYRIIRDYGEEQWASRIAQFIVEEREREPIKTTGQLVEIIKKAIPIRARRTGPHPAKRTFQAIRIEVNNELGLFGAIPSGYRRCFEARRKAVRDQLSQLGGQSGQARYAEFGEALHLPAESARCVYAGQCRRSRLSLRQSSPARRSLRRTQEAKVRNCVVPERI